MKHWIKKASLPLGFAGSFVVVAALTFSCGLLDELRGDLDLEIDVNGNKVSFVFDAEGNAIPVTTNGKLVFNALLDTELKYKVNDGTERTHKLEGRAEVVELDDVGEPTDEGTLYAVDVKASYDDATVEGTFKFIVSKSGFAFDQLHVKGSGPDGEFSLDSESFVIDWENGDISAEGSATFKLRASSNMTMNFELFAGQGIADDATPLRVSGGQSTNINVVGLEGEVNGKPIEVTLEFPEDFGDTLTDGDPYTLRMTATRGDGGGGITTQIVREVVYTHDADPNAAPSGNGGN